MKQRRRQQKEKQTGVVVVLFFLWRGGEGERDHEVDGNKMIFSGGG